jgi:hypothetical protein
MDPTIILFLGAVMGVLAKTFIIPTLRKWKEDPNFVWDHQYTAAAVFSIVISFVSVIMGYSGTVPPGADLWGVLLRGFKDGFVLNYIIDEAFKAGPPIAKRLGFKK